MVIGPKDAAEVASIVKATVDTLKGLGEALRNYRLRKKQIKQIEKEAVNVLRLATAEEIDELVLKPRKKKIDYMTGAADTTGRRGGPPAVARKKKSKMAATTRRYAVPRKKAKKKK